MPVLRSEKKRIDSRGPKYGVEHMDTPKKVRLRQTVAIFDRTGPTPVYRSKADIFRELGVSRANAYRIIQSNLDRSRPVEETRGRPPIITAEMLQKYERIVTSNEKHRRQISWNELALQADIDCSARTIERAMGSLNYRQCIAYRKGWVSP